MVIDACEEDPDCQQSYPVLENRFLEVVPTLSKEPIKIEDVSGQPIFIDVRVCFGHICHDLQQRWHGGAAHVGKNDRRGKLLDFPTPGSITTHLAY